MSFEDSFTVALNAITTHISKVEKYAPKRIIKNKDTMIVFWHDGTKTVVKRAEDEIDSDYAAFTAALARKIYGSNSALKRIVARTETQKPKKQKERKQNEN